MRARRTSKFLALVIAALGLAGARESAAQPWPSRPVTIVMPFSAGATGDLVARSFAEYLAKEFGQPVVVDNRTGAGGNVGGASVARAAPDGYTLLLATTGPAANNKLMYKNMPYDPQRDLVPIALMGKSPVIVTARADFPATNLKELVAYGKANPGAIKAGYPGNGTLGHITGELLQNRTETKFVQVQYRGSPAIINDMLGGHIDIGMDFDRALCVHGAGEEVARARDCRCPTLAATARCANDRRIGVSGIRGERLVRAHGATPDSERYHC